MKPRICSHCIFGVYDPAFAARQLRARWGNTLLCANCAECPGRVRAVSPGHTCRNFTRRRAPSCRLPAPEPAVGNTRLIPLTQGKFALVDAADFDRLNQYTWYTMVCGRTTYAFRRANGKHIFMHRQIMKTPKGQVVDHINHNGIDNRRANMRNCYPRHNMYNARARRGTSRYRGVCRHHGVKWSADISYLWVRVHIGLFTDEVEAARARDRMAIMLHGRYAYLNFPDHWPPKQRKALYNSPEAVQARADIEKRSTKRLRARRKARLKASLARQKLRRSEGKKVGKPRRLTKND
ncbi:MAG: hypothetical protein JXN61_00760 [Sedimentisphaerales bacterium]|nr:hypothetical protein [Sedimentisphaerales bacterium]